MLPRFASLVRSFAETSNPLEDAPKPQKDGDSDDAEPFAAVLRVRGGDQPGILHAVSRIMAESDFSVERFETTVDDEDHPGGQSLFLMEGLVVHKGEEGPDWSPIDAIEGCDDFSEKYNIDCELEPYDDDEPEVPFDPDDPDSPFKVEDVAHEIEDWTPRDRIYKPEGGK